MTEFNSIEFGIFLKARKGCQICTMTDDMADPINTTCPRSGKPVVANSLTMYRGMTVGFCNQQCRDDFASNVDERPDDRKFFDEVAEAQHSQTEETHAVDDIEVDELLVRHTSLDVEIEKYAARAGSLQTVAGSSKWKLGTISMAFLRSASL